MKKPIRSPSSLQSLGLLMFGACVVVVLIFFIAWLAYDPAQPSYGLHGEIAYPIMLTYGPVVLGTLFGVIGMLLKTYVAVDKAKPMPAIVIHRGTAFLRFLALAGPGVALAIILLLAFTLIPSESYEVWCGIGAGTWSMTTGLIFSRFFAQYAAEHAPVAPVSPPVTGA